MRLGKRALVAMAGTLAIGGSMLGIAVHSAGAAAPPPVNAANDTITCNTVIAKLSFNPALTSTGATSGAENVSVSGKVAGCTTSAATTVTGGTFSTKDPVTKIDVPLVSDGGSNCLSLAGLHNLTGNLNFKWSTATGAPKLVNNQSIVGTNHFVGNVLSLHTANGGGVAQNGTDNQWDAQYGEFQLGVTQTGNPMSVTGSFTGGNGGATSVSRQATQLDVGALLGTACTTKGSKSATIGIGYVTLQ